MRFSIIIPLYQQEKFVCDCVDSVLSQSFSDFQILLVDDGSTDSTPAICDDYAERDSRVTVIHKANGGLSDARNSGALAAQGEYLVFLDGDDMLANDALRNVDEAISAAGMPNIVICSLSRFTDDGAVFSGSDEMEELPDSGSIDILLDYAINRGSGFNPSVCRYAVNKCFYDGAGISFEKGMLHEDELYSPLLICAAENYAVNRSPFYLYRSHTGTITTMPSLKNKTDMLLAAHLLLKERDRYGKDPKRASMLNERAKWLFQRGILESTTLKGSTARRVAAAAAPVCAEEPGIVDELPKLKKLVHILGSRAGIEAFLRLVKIKRGIKKLLGK